MQIKKIVLAAFAAIMLLSLFGGTASANRSLEASATVISLLAPALTLKAAGIPIVCEVGVTITLNRRTFAKSERVNIGRAEFRVLREQCRGGRARVLAGPFNVNYLGFAGTLPTITGLLFQVLRVAFLVDLEGFARCLVTTNAAGFQRVTAGRIEELRGEARGEVYGLESTSIINLRGLFPCPAEAREYSLEGRFNAVTAVTVRLL